MVFIIDLLKFLLPVLYFWTVWMYAKVFFSGSKFAESFRTPLLLTLVVAHFCYLLLRTIVLAHPPITNVYETLTNIAFCITLAYTYLEFRTKVSGTGYFILILPFFFQFISSVFINDALPIREVLRSNLLAFHVTSALLGFSAITISGVYGFLYLMLYHDIKATRFSVIYNRLPNLEVLERMSSTAAALGFVLLTVAIAVGLVWLPRAFDDFSYADPKLLGTIAVWALYGLGILGKKFIGWEGKKVVWLSVCGFALALFSMTIINMFLGGFHKFY